MDQPDVPLEEDDTPVPEEAADDLMETDEAAPKPSKKAFKLSYEKHKKMSFLLIKLVLLLLLQPALTCKDNPVLTWVYTIIKIIKQHENILKTIYLPISEK